MSSPIALAKRSSLRDCLIQLHQHASHGHRTSLLAQHFSELISSSVHQSDRELECLDIGCGDMSIAEKISAICPSKWACVDLYELPSELLGDPRWAKYQRFDGQHLPFERNTFDVALLCDVLHHTDDEQKLALLREAARVARYVLIKEHYETGLISRMLLQLMDIVGNWGYGVSIPRRYFTKLSFAASCEQTGLSVVQSVNGVKLYDHSKLLRAILSPKLQFIAIVAKAEL